MKLFITGATGFIGKHLVSKLLEEGYFLTINLLKNEQSSFDQRVLTYMLNEENIHNDIEYLQSEAFDGVIHLASLYLKDHQPEDVTRLIDSNLRFSSYILECAARSKIKWFINTGTFWQNYNNAEYSPVNLYAASKQAFESIASYYIETNQINFFTLKLSDTYGPNDTRPKIFNIWEKNAKNGEILEMSPGNQIIDISYIDDIIEAYILLIKHIYQDRNIFVNGSVFAVKADTRYTLKELASIFEITTKQKLSINWGKLPYRSREVMIPWEFGTPVPDWKPKVSIINGIIKTFMPN